MPESQKVSLNVFVNRQVRTWLKIKAASEGVTMATLLQKIILEWQKSHDSIQ
jgi:hypothetical protein